MRHEAAKADTRKERICFSYNNGSLALASRILSSLSNCRLFRNVFRCEIHNDSMDSQIIETLADACLHTLHIFHRNATIFEQSETWNIVEFSRATFNFTTLRTSPAAVDGSSLPSVQTHQSHTSCLLYHQVLHRTLR